MFGRFDILTTMKKPLDKQQKQSSAEPHPHDCFEKS